MPRLLWTDDDGPNRFMMEEFTLRQAGWTVVWARGLRSAVEALATAPHDALLLDQMLPWSDPEDQRAGRDGVDVWGGCLLLWWLRRGAPPPAAHPGQLARFADMWDRAPLPANRALPVAVVSAFDDPDVRVQLAAVSEAGPGGRPPAVPVWTKPVDRDVLMDFVGALAGAPS